ncbi:MAG TPA: DNA internalization-related competence protein ComEC/Rec2 [Gammaproteobacteria bacterium]|nr:DNA internalization-related competence protein ComEC/Rec2 [Gammaproteobacteria bacterium]
MQATYSRTGFAAGITTVSRAAIICAFVGGALWVQRWAALPASGWCLCGGALLVCWRRWPRYRGLYAALLGICCAVFWGNWRLHTVLPEDLAGRDLGVEGYIATIPDTHERGLRFDFAVMAYPDISQDLAAGLPRLLRLSWYDSATSPRQSPLPGEYWRLKVRLKPAHGFMNPGTFDYEALLCGQGIRATGYVRGDGNQRLRAASGRFILQRLRHSILSRIRALAPAGAYTGLISALAIGYQSDITREQWQLLADTGTTHLISISGLHISMVAGLCCWLAFWLHAGLLSRFATRYPLWPAQRTAATAGLCSALVYCALAGFSLPTVRSLLMLSVVFCALFFYRLLRPWQSLLTALALVVAFDPFALNNVSFWLSFSAVAVLVYLLSGRFRSKKTEWRAAGWRRGLYRWGFVQLALVPALIPLTLFWFGRTALTATLANFIAIPLVSCIVVPLILLAAAAAFINQIAAVSLFTAAALLLQWLWQVLQWLAALPYGQWSQYPPPPALLALAVCGLLWLLAPRGVPARWAGIACLLPVFWHQPPGPPAEGDAWLTVLDVGQGTAAVVRTRRHVLLYDTGPRFSRDFDAGSAVVVPYLRAQGVRVLDMLVVSHSDNDHQGGVEAVLRAIPARRVLAGEPARYPQALPSAGPCGRGQRWQWDGVSFEILAPAPDSTARGNNASCVLSIETPGGAILLPGDIEREVEEYLLSESGLHPADILLLPHHGSRSSSTPDFVAAVHPRYAVATADYRNRYGFPAADVAARYREAGARLLVTGYTGAVEFRLDHALGVAEPVLYRQAGRRYWQHIPLPGD